MDDQIAQPCRVCPSLDFSGSLFVGIAHAVFRLAAKLPDEATVCGCGTRGWPTPTPTRASNVAAWERDHGRTVGLPEDAGGRLDRPAGLYGHRHANGVAGAAERAGDYATDAGAAMTMAAMPRRMRRDFFGSLEDAWGVMGSTQPVNALVRITNLGK